MITTCFIIVGILVVGYMIYLAVQEDSKQCELVNSNVEAQSHKEQSTNLFEQVNKLFSDNEDCDEAVFRGVIFNYCIYFDFSTGVFELRSHDGHDLEVNRFIHTPSYELHMKLVEWYGEPNSDTTTKFLSDFLKEVTFRKSSSRKITELRRSCNLFKSRVSFIGTMTTHYTWEDQWVSINNGEYYTENLNTLYRFKDWKIIDNDEEVWSILEHATLEKCEDPKKEHWEHFLTLEMEAKKLREKECHKFVDGVLAKQVKYNDLQLQYEMLPSAPITDIETFKNFCLIVHEEVCYNDYEIQNYLLLKKHK